MTDFYKFAAEKPILTFLLVSTICGAISYSCYCFAVAITNIFKRK